MKLYTSLIEAIRDTRKEKDLTQKQIAELAGISQSHYNKIETGKTQPGSKLIDKLLSILNLKIIKENHEK